MKETYEYDDCTICGGLVTEKLVEKVSIRHVRIAAVIEDMPAGVCEQCGERYYRAEVVKNLEEIVSHINASRTNITIPLEQYAA